MRGVRAPHRPTAHTAHPPIRGCAAGCAVGGPTPRPGAPVVAIRMGRGGPPTAASRDIATGPLHPSCFMGCHVIQRECPQPFPGRSIPAPAILRAAAGRSRARRGVSWRSPASVGAKKRSTPTLAYPAPNGTARSCWLCPFGGQSTARTAADWPPYGGVERPRRVVRFARLMHRRVRALDGPSARAGFGGDPMTNRLPRMVVLQSPRP